MKFLGRYKFSVTYFGFYANRERKALEMDADSEIYRVFFLLDCFFNIRRGRYDNEPFLGVFLGGYNFSATYFEFCVQREKIWKCTWTLEYTEFSFSSIVFQDETRKI